MERLEVRMARQRAADQLEATLRRSRRLWMVFPPVIGFVWGLGAALLLG